MSQSDFLFGTVLTLSWELSNTCDLGPGLRPSGCGVPRAIQTSTSRAMMLGRKEEIKHPNSLSKTRALSFPLSRRLHDMNCLL
jgi:hypothetical protein